MIKRLLHKMFGGGREPSAAPATTVTYQNFEIRPAPVKEPSGWRVQGTIAADRDGELKEHLFIRADACADRDSAIALTVRKAQQLIDERGDKLFD